MSSYNGYKKCFIDVETTGTDRKLHNIFQIAGIIRDENDVILDEFNFKFKPFSLEHFEEMALTQTNVTIEELENLNMTSTEAYEALIQVLSKHCNRFNKKDKLLFVAYNAKFDDDFIREFFAKHDDKYYGSWFWAPPLCVMQMAMFFLMDHRGAFPNFKLGTLCECAGFKWDDTEAHDALYDIRMTMRLFDYLRANMKTLGE
jgi:DNA polymerase III alpha subunit (gram-positive type)